MAFFVFVKMGMAPLSRALREMKQLLCVQSLILYYIKQIDSMLPCICPVIDHRGRQNVVRTSVTHSAIASCATFLFLPHFDVICDLLLDRCTATWKLFVKWTVSMLVAGALIEEDTPHCLDELQLYCAPKYRNQSIR